MKKIAVFNGHSNFENLENNIGELLLKKSPIVIVLDGGSGSGKSTVAKKIEQQFKASVISLDDFFSADIPDEEWDTFSVETKLKKVFNWDRVRLSALKPLLNRQQAKWQRFDFEAGIQSDGTYKMKPDYITLDASDLIIIEGALLP